MAEGDRYTVWVTKYALTSGVFKATAEECHVPTMVAVELGGALGALGYNGYFHGEDWHRTKEQAEARVHLMIDRKIKSLRKQIAALEELRTRPLEVKEYP